MGEADLIGHKADVVIHLALEIILSLPGRRGSGGGGGGETSMVSPPQFIRPAC